MFVTEMLKLSPSESQAELLFRSMRAFNEAANYCAEVAFEHTITNRNRLQHLVYYDIRKRFELPAEMAIRSIAKTCGAYKRDKKIKPNFRSLGAIAYDQRNLSWKGKDQVSIQTLSGRILVSVVYQGRRNATDDYVRRGHCDLVFRDGNFYLAVIIDVPEPVIESEPKEWVGVDLGVVNIATDSDGVSYSGKGLRATRRRNIKLRARLQRIGTKSAKRLLKKRRRKESRLAKDINHCISKALIGKAKGTDRGIKLENLSGIRDRIMVSRAQRADLNSWSFYQLRAFIEYKAAISGVRIELIDPRNTSRECSECGYIDKKNRPNRDDFKCLRCGYAAPADFNAARVISCRGGVTRPNAAVKHQPDASSDLQS